MQPKQMQQHQMTQRQMTPRQMSNPQFTRQHNEHQHGMTIANPQKDRRQMTIPTGTFEEVGGFNFGGSSRQSNYNTSNTGSFSLYRWLMTWLFSLVALIALPLAAVLIFMGIAMQSSTAVWTEVSAEVTDFDEEKGIDYRYEDEAGSRQRASFSYELEHYLTSSSNQVTLSISSCDLLSRFWIPQEDDATFSLWLNPEDNTQVSCIPVSADIGATLIFAGFGLLIFAVLQLFRTINAAAAKPSR